MKKFTTREHVEFHLAKYRRKLEKLTSDYQLHKEQHENRIRGLENKLEELDSNAQNL